MTLTKRKSGTYHASFRGADGRTRTITTKSKDRAEALRILKASKLPELEAIAKADRLTAEVVIRLTAGKKVTVQQAFEHWSAWLLENARSPRTARNNIECVLLWLKQTNVSTKPTTGITAQDIDKWINDPESDAKANTRNWHRSGLRQFFEYCSTQNWVLKNPVETVRVRFNLLSHKQKEIIPRSVFSDQDIRALLAGLIMDQAKLDAEIARLVAAEAHVNKLDPLYADSARLTFWQFAVLISWDIGLRLGDICQLEWACFDLPGMATVWTDKRDRRVHVPITLPVSDSLTAIPVLHARYLFPEERKLVLDPQKRSKLSVQFARLCQRHGIKGKTFHGIRHARCTRWHDEGITLETIAANVGHTSTAVTKGYVHES